MGFRSAFAGVVGPLLAVVLVARDASAVDPRNFEPAASNAAVIGLDTTWVSPPLVPFVSLDATYVNDELVDRSGAVGPILDERVITTLGVGIALVDPFELSVGLPLHISNVAAGNETTLGDVRAQAKFRVLGPQRGDAGLGLALTVGATFPTGDASAFASDDGVGVDPRLLVDWRSRSGAVLTFGAGYRHRKQTEVFGLMIGDEVRFGVGTEIPFAAFGSTTPLSILGEVEGGIGVAGDDPGNEQQRAFEARLGVRFRSEKWSATLASGTGFSKGYGTPDFRLVFGIAWGASPVQAPEVKLVAAPDEAEPQFPPIAPVEDVEAVMIAEDPDADVDGVPLANDKCPTEPEDIDQFEDGDGCPEPDNDVDGVLDVADKCPTEKEVVNGYKDEDGCADVVPPVPGNDAAAKAAAVGPSIRPDGHIELPGPIAFRSGSDVLLPAADPFLAQVATFLSAHPEVKRLRIEGHTDDMGDKEFNVDLSERRAARVRMALVERGVKADRLLPKGFGPTQPLVPNTNDQNRAKNRRVEMRIVDGPNVVPAMEGTP